jgi:hypothetical protein
MYPKYLLESSPEGTLSWSLIGAYSPKNAFTARLEQGFDFPLKVPTQNIMDLPEDAPESLTSAKATRCQRTRNMIARHMSFNLSPFWVYFMA